MRRWQCWFQPHDWRRDPVAMRRTRYGEQPPGPRVKVACQRCGETRAALAPGSYSPPSKFQCAEVECWPKFEGTVLSEPW